MPGIDGEDGKRQRYHRDLRAPHLQCGELGSTGKYQGAHEHAQGGRKFCLGRSQPKGRAEGDYKNGNGHKLLEPQPYILAIEVMQVFSAVRHLGLSWFALIECGRLSERRDRRTSSPWAC